MDDERYMKAFQGRSDDTQHIALSRPLASRLAYIFKGEKAARLQMSANERLQASANE
jgi:hypothetical protein